MRDALSRALNTIWPSSVHVATVADDGRDTRALFDRASSLRRSSSLAGQDLLHLAIDIMRDTVAQSDAEPSLDVQVAIACAIQRLMTAEGMAELEIDWGTLDLGGYEGSHLRQYLKDQIRFFEKFDTNMPRWRTTVENIFVGILSYLVVTGMEGTDDEDAGFRVSLIDLLDTPDEVIERLIGTPFGADLVYAGLFRDIRETFNENALMASGIDPSDRNSKKQIVVPTEYRHDTPFDLVRTYVSRTAFLPFFTHSVPFAIPEQARFEHCHVLGGTGHGKTQLLQHLIYADLKRAQTERRSVVVIDSQGDLIRKIAHLSLFDPDREDTLAGKLVLIDPSDIEYPVALNMFDMRRDRIEGYSAAERERVLNGTIELYENFFGSLLGRNSRSARG